MKTVFELMASLFATLIITIIIMVVTAIAISDEASGYIGWPVFIFLNALTMYRLFTKS